MPRLCSSTAPTTACADAPLDGPRSTSALGGGHRATHLLPRDAQRVPVQILLTPVHLQLRLTPSICYSNLFTSTMAASAQWPRVNTSVEPVITRGLVSAEARPVGQQTVAAVAGAVRTRHSHGTVKRVA